MILPAVLVVVILSGLLLATGRVHLPKLPRELNGYPVPMLIFSAIVVVGFLVAGML
jgi:hypothetical protein